MDTVKKKLSILLVDDEVDLLDAIHDTISGYFEQVFTASSVKQALTLLDKEPIDVVLCDFKMPHQDGLMLQKIMKESYPGVYFVLITGFSQEPRISEAQSQNYFPVLDKPLKPDVIFSELMKVLTPSTDSIVKRKKENSF